MPTLCSGYNFVSADMIAESLMEDGGEGFVEGVKLRYGTICVRQVGGGTVFGKKCDFGCSPAV